jgi:hypothetical protein
MDINEKVEMIKNLTIFADKDKIKDIGVDEKLYQTLQEVFNHLYLEDYLEDIDGIAKFFEIKPEIKKEYITERLIQEKYGKYFSMNNGWGPCKAEILKQLTGISPDIKQYYMLIQEQYAKLFSRPHSLGDLKLLKELTGKKPLIDDEPYNGHVECLPEEYQTVNNINNFTVLRLMKAVETGGVNEIMVALDEITPGERVFHYNMPNKQQIREKYDFYRSKGLEKEMSILEYVTEIEPVF